MKVRWGLGAWKQAIGQALDTIGSRMMAMSMKITEK